MDAVAITGIGVVSALGCDAGILFAALVNGDCAIRAIPLPGPDAQGSIWFAPVEGAVLPAWCDERLRDGMDVLAQWAVAAAEQAICDARVEMDPLRTAVVHGSSLCGVQSVMRAQYEVDRHGAAGFPRKTMIRALSNMPAAQICMHYGLHGPSLSLATACASALDALGTAASLICSGQCDVAIAGATEAGEGFASGGMEGDFVPAMAYAPAAFGMQSVAAEARFACMPFDTRRSGVAGSEGSVFFVLERAERAAARAADVYGYLLGYASLADAWHPSAPDPSGRWEARVMELALADAGIDAKRVDALIAHGTGTPKGDSAEIAAINAVHGGRALPVSSIKGHIGHAAAASAGLSLVAGLLGMRDSTLVHTANTTSPDPEARFDIVTGAPRPLEIGVLQVNAFGFGGQNASIVVSRDRLREA